MSLSVVARSAQPQIVQYWAEGDLPPALSRRIRAWQDLNPAWAHSLFDRQSAATFLKGLFGNELAQAFLDIRLPAMQADVFRVAIICARGGLWVDAATTCLAPLGSWLDVNAPLVLLRKPEMLSPLVWNGFIYSSTPGHPFLTAVWNQIAIAILHRQGTGIWKLFGPGLYRDLLRDGGYDHCIQVLNKETYASGLRIGSSGEVLPPDQHWSNRQRQESLYFGRGIE
jgi:mannosyltransferase OCH1-like enzyme